MSDFSRLDLDQPQLANHVQTPIEYGSLPRDLFTRHKEGVNRDDASKDHGAESSQEPLLRE